MARIRALGLIALLAFCGAAPAAAFYAEVAAVLDGDTLLVERAGQMLKIRLAEIDAPEKAQPYGAASQRSLEEMVRGKRVKIVSRARDDYGRTVADVSIGGININREQVKRGMAWDYSRFHRNPELMALQREAQHAKRGLWAGDEIVEPSQWRKSGGRVPVSPQTQSAAEAAGFVCGDKRRCAQMASCGEARYYLAQCGLQSLDGDRDGMPCEQLCAEGGAE